MATTPTDSMNPWYDIGPPASMSRLSSQDSELSGSAIKPSMLDAVKYWVAMRLVDHSHGHALHEIVRHALPVPPLLHRLPVSVRVRGPYDEHVLARYGVPFEVPRAPGPRLSGNLRLEHGGLP